MQGYNVIAVFDENTDKVLMCRRRKNPYRGIIKLYRRQDVRIRKTDRMILPAIWKIAILKSMSENEIGQSQPGGTENNQRRCSPDNNLSGMLPYARAGKIGHTMKHTEIHKKDLTK